jgi:hypothetical protein
MAKKYTDKFRDCYLKVQFSGKLFVIVFSSMIFPKREKNGAKQFFICENVLNDMGNGRDEYHYSILFSCVMFPNFWEGTMSKRDLFYDKMFGIVGMLMHIFATINYE